MTKIKTKKLEEEYLTKFLNSNLGRKWYEGNSIIEIKESEAPDYIFKTSNNRTIGFEITQFFYEHKNKEYSQVLTTIGNKICKMAKEKYNIEISILINQYDRRELSPNQNEILDYAYNPGFAELPPLKQFKTELEKILLEGFETLIRYKLVQKWIKIEDEYYQISMQTFPSISSGKFDCHVNNAGEVKFNPFEELQACIERKNVKVKKYCKNMDKLCLLVFVPDGKLGNFCSFNFEIDLHKFISNFDEIFLCEEKGNCYHLNNK